MTKHHPLHPAVNLCIKLLLVIISSVIVIADQASAVPPDMRPKPANVIVFLIDELRYDEVIREARPSFVETPNIDSLAAEGVSFSNFYTVSTICSPNRASLLTGQHPAMHGVVDNTDRSQLSHQLPTFAVALHEAGYDTAFVGKWHMGNDPTPRPGFDYWAAIPGQGRMWDPELWKQGRLQTMKGYVTDVLTDEAVTFLRQARDKPFMLYLSHKAIHPDARQNTDSSVDLAFGMRYEAAPRHQGRYADQPISFPPNVQSMTVDPPGKPVLARALARKRSQENVAKWGSILTLDATADTRRRRAEMLLSIDDSVGRIIEEVRRQGKLDDTLIVFTSDNATNVGEHGLTVERRLPYESVIHLPFIMYYKGWLSEGSTTLDALALNIDIAPTLIEAAGLAPSTAIQGRSLKPLVASADKPNNGKPVSNWRQSFLIEHRPDERPFSWLLDMSYLAVRDHNLKYINWLRYPNEPELYDLAKDPYEQHNLIHDPRYQANLPALRRELGRLVLESRGLNGQ